MGAFKQQMMNDLQDTFLNTEDFGIQVTLVRDGVLSDESALR